MEKIERDELEAMVSNVSYTVSGTLTVAVVELYSGFKAVGKSACVNPADFDAKLGEKYAVSDAIDQLWELEGYHRLASAVSS